MEVSFGPNYSSGNPDIKTARLIGALFVFLCVPLAMWGLTYVPSKIFVQQNPGATAHNLLSNEFLFRTSIVSHLSSTTIFAFIVLLLYRVLRPANKHLSRLMAVPAFAQLPIVIILEVFNFTALMVLKSEPRPTFDVAQQQEIAHLLLRIHRYGIGAAQICFGLCFIPWGMLVLRSGFLPKVFGILLIISGIGYVIDCCTYILLQRPAYLMIRPFVTFSFAGYLLTMLWLLVMGVRFKKVPVNPVSKL